MTHNFLRIRIKNKFGNKNLNKNKDSEISLRNYEELKRMDNPGFSLNGIYLYFFCFYLFQSLKIINLL